MLERVLCGALPRASAAPTTHAAGKVAYYAPEMYRQEDYDGRKVDAWTVGVGLFILLTGNPPYLKQDAAECQCVSGEGRAVPQARHGAATPAPCPFAGTSPR